jgi:putative PIN family toxin of toxin-antitoxin system
VLDTTVLISAFLRPRGVSDELLTLADKEFAFLLSAPIVAEARRKLLTSEKIRKRYHYPDEAAERYVERLSELAALAGLVEQLPPLSGVVRDPNDDVIVATAAAAQADYLVARDKDLLDLGHYQGMPILTAEVFRGLLRRRA